MESTCTQMCPDVVRCTQVLPYVPWCCHMYPGVAICTQVGPYVTMWGHMYPGGAICSHEWPDVPRSDQVYPGVTMCTQVWPDAPRCWQVLPVFHFLAPYHNLGQENKHTISAQLGIVQYLANRRLFAMLLLPQRTFKGLIIQQDLTTGQ